MDRRVLVFGSYTVFTFQEGSPLDLFFDLAMDK